MRVVSGDLLLNMQFYPTLEELFKAIARNRVNDRPGRMEPRVIKRRKSKYSLMMKPRRILKEKLVTIASRHSLN